MEKFKLCREETRLVYITVIAKSKVEALRLADGDWERKVTPWAPKCKWKILGQ